MTSNTTWGNKPSFGMTLSVEGAGGDVWKAFDGDAETAWEGQCPANARITLRAGLEHPVLISAIHIQLRSNRAQFLIGGVAVGSGTTVTSIKTLALQAALNNVVVKVPEKYKNVKWKGLVLLFIPLSAGPFAFYECAIEGVFDPADLHS